MVGKYEERDAFVLHLKNLENDGKNDITQYEVTRHHPYVPDSVTTCEGGVHFEEDADEQGLFRFKIALGPVNARKLLDFLMSLPDEPGYDDEEDDLAHAAGGA